MPTSLSLDPRTCVVEGESWPSASCPLTFMHTLEREESIWAAHGLYIHNRPASAFLTAASRCVPPLVMLAGFFLFTNWLFIFTYMCLCVHLPYMWRPHTHTHTSWCWNYKHQACTQLLCNVLMVQNSGSHSCFDTTLPTASSPSPPPFLFFWDQFSRLVSKSRSSRVNILSARITDISIPYWLK